MATRIGIRFTNDFAPPVLQLVQGTDAVSFTFACEDFFPGTGASARIYVKKPSGLEVYDACTVSGALITAPITTQMTAEVGRAEAQINIASGGKVANSFKFYLDVFENIIDGSAIQSTSEYTALQGLILEASYAIEEAQAAADIALSAANNYFVTATYSYSGGVHTLSVPAEYASAKMIRFVPTQAWASGNTLRIQFGTATATNYGAKTFSGDDLPDGAWAAGASVTFTINSGNAYFPIQEKPDPVESSSTTVNLGGNSTVTLVKFGKIVVGYFTLPGPWGAGVTTLSGQIPAGYRPTNNFRSAFFRAYSGQSLSNNGMQLLIGTNGTIQMIATDSMANTWSYQCTLTWATT